MDHRERTSNFLHSGHGFVCVSLAISLWLLELSLFFTFFFLSLHERNAIRSPQYTFTTAGRLEGAYSVCKVLHTTFNSLLLDMVLRIIFVLEHFFLILLPKCDSYRPYTLYTLYSGIHCILYSQWRSTNIEWSTGIYEIDPHTHCKLSPLYVL